MEEHTCEAKIPYINENGEKIGDIGGQRRRTLHPSNARWPASPQQNSCWCMNIRRKGQPPHYSIFFVIVILITCLFIIIICCTHRHHQCGQERMLACITIASRPRGVPRYFPQLYQFNNISNIVRCLYEKPPYDNRKCGLHPFNNISNIVRCLYEKPHAAPMVVTEVPSVMRSRRLQL